MKYIINLFLHMFFNLFFTGHVQNPPGQTREPLTGRG